MPLSPRQTRHLRALAHHLDPIVYVGSSGVTDAVIDKLDKELEHHELVKVRVDADREDLPDAAHRLSAGTRSEVAQIIGKMVIVYRRRSKDPTIRLPEP